MSTTPPIDPMPATLRHARESERVSLLFVIATSIICWYVIAAVNFAEQRQEECRAMWVVQQNQELTQEGPAL